MTDHKHHCKLIAFRLGPEDSRWIELVYGEEELRSWEAMTFAERLWNHLLSIDSKERCPNCGSIPQEIVFDFELKDGGNLRFSFGLWRITENDKVVAETDWSQLARYTGGKLKEESDAK